MGNCANKPLANEGEEPAPVEKTTEVSTVERDIKVDESNVTVTATDAAAVHEETKPPSLAQVLEEEGKKGEAKEGGKAAEEKPSVGAKTEETKKEENAGKEEAAAPITEPAKPTVPSTEAAKPAASEAKKEATTTPPPAAVSQPNKQDQKQAP